MEPENKITKNPLNFCTTPNANILYGAALTLAWKELTQRIIKEDVKIQSNDPIALDIVHKFNNATVSKADLSPESYYGTAGFGNQTVQKINKEVAKKFPDKTTPPIEPNLDASDIIAYAYFLKKLQFQHRFGKREVTFNDKKVDGFIAKVLNQKQQILVHHYKSRDNLVVQLRTKQPNEGIFIIRTPDKNIGIQQISSYLKKHKKKHALALTKEDKFEMPIVDIECRHDVKELLSKKLANEKFNQYQFSEIYEIIKLKINETGVTVENEGVIKMKRMAVLNKEPPKEIIIDGPFWLVMKEKGKKAYFMANIQNVYDK